MQDFPLAPRVPPPPPDPVQQITQRLQAELGGLFEVISVETRARGRLITFAGRLLAEPDRGFSEIQRRFRPLGYTPLLSQERGQHQLMAVEGLEDQARTGNPLVNLLLFVITILTTLAAGAQMASGQSLLEALRSGSWAQIVDVMLVGAPFAVTLLGILGVHELGHYVAARLHGVRATLPYFIPMPVGGLGTLGAFIAIKSPMKDRKVLFDIGLSGPIAGFIVAVPLLFLGLYLSSNGAAVRGPSFSQLGSSIMVDFIVDVFADRTPIRAHPIYFAAWLGFFLTGINLLPVGQLDGGHVTYALLGRGAHIVAVFTFLGLLAAGVFLSPNWYIWAFFILFGGLRHPPPLNDMTNLGWSRRIMGALAVILFILIVIPVPFPN